jgi:hypothetical protein
MGKHKFKIGDKFLVFTKNTYKIVAGCPFTYKHGKRSNIECVDSTGEERVFKKNEFVFDFVKLNYNYVP